MLGATTSKWGLNGEAWAVLLRIRTGPKCPEGNLRELMWNSNPNCGIARERKEFMIWATVSSQSCFCWLNINFSIFRCKYNQSDFDIDHLVTSMCKVISFVTGRGCLLWPVPSLDKTLLAFALLHFVLQDQTCLLLQVSLDFLLLHSSPLWWKGHPLGVLVLEGLVGYHRTFQLQLLQH